MTRRAEEVDLIRQMIRGDHEEYRRRCDEFDQQGWEGVGLVVAAAFYLAVQDGLGDADSASVIRFVADARADLVASGFDLDPKSAETLITAAQTGNTAAIEGLPANEVVETEMLLLWRLLEQRPQDELESFLGRASKLADEWSQGE